MCVFYERSLVHYQQLKQLGNFLSDQYLELSQTDPFFSFARSVNDSIISSITYQITTLRQANLACSCKYIQIFFGLETSSEISYEQDFASFL